MDDLRAPATNLENGEEWITKYRAALDAAVIEHTRSARYRAALEDFLRLAVSTVQKTAQRWVRAVLARARTAQSRLNLF